MQFIFIFCNLPYSWRFYVLIEAVIMINKQILWRVIKWMTQTQGSCSLIIQKREALEKTSGENLIGGFHQSEFKSSLSVEWQAHSSRDSDDNVSWSRVVEKSNTKDCRHSFQEYSYLDERTARLTTADSKGNFICVGNKVARARRANGRVKFVVFENL